MYFFTKIWSGLRAFHWSLNVTMLGEICFNSCADYRVIQYQGIGTSIKTWFSGPMVFQRELPENLKSLIRVEMQSRLRRYIHLVIIFINVPVSNPIAGLTDLLTQPLCMVFGDPVEFDLIQWWRSNVWGSRSWIWSRKTAEKKSRFSR